MPNISHEFVYRITKLKTALEDTFLDLLGVVIPSRYNHKLGRFKRQSRRSRNDVEGVDEEGKGNRETFNRKTQIVCICAQGVVIAKGGLRKPPKEGINN